MFIKETVVETRMYWPYSFGSSQLVRIGMITIEKSAGLAFEGAYLMMSVYRLLFMEVCLKSQSPDILKRAKRENGR
jgi:hypothetical protein